jgi:hypothetical protein
MNKALRSHFTHFLTMFYGYAPRETTIVGFFVEPIKLDYANYRTAFFTAKEAITIVYSYLTNMRY